MIKNIIFDFDGVILNSVPIKTEAFKQLFKEFPSSVVKQFILYHEANGGISRYVKIQYFFETLLHRNITKAEILQYASTYSLLTKEELINPEYIIKETVNFIKKFYNKYHMHIASGADEKDLIYICKSLNLESYFLSIHGSPTPKTDIIKDILTKNFYLEKETIMIGDSVNDYDAAKRNNIIFYGYNNEELKKISHTHYISDKESFEKAFQSH